MLVNTSLMQLLPIYLRYNDKQRSLSSKKIESDEIDDDKTHSSFIELKGFIKIIIFVDYIKNTFQ